MENKHGFKKKKIKNKKKTTGEKCLDSVALNG
jgi:hypothetical protein